MKKKVFCVVLALAMGALTGCKSLPSIERAQSKFCHEHSTATVLGASEQLTNRYAQFHFYYLNPGDNQEHEDVWFYHQAAESWVCGKMERIK